MSEKKNFYLSVSLFLVAALTGSGCRPTIVESDTLNVAASDSTVSDISVELVPGAGGTISLTYHNVLKNRDIYADAQDATYASPVWNPAANPNPTINVVVAADAMIGSESADRPALVTNDRGPLVNETFHSSAVINITVEEGAIIAGAGGDGGNYTDNDPFSNGGEGGIGLAIYHPITLNNFGTIAGGGGGGGGGEAATMDTGDDGAGAGGAGSKPGHGGMTGCGAGEDGAFLTGGVVLHGTGGVGGDLGMNGADGEYSPGGAGGWAMIGTALILNAEASAWSATGTYLGRNSSVAADATFAAAFALAKSGNDPSEWTKEQDLAPFVAQFLTSTGVPVAAGTAVTWTIVAGNGSFQADSCDAVTNAAGEASCILTTGAGTAANKNGVVAEVGPLKTVFYANKYVDCSGAPTADDIGAVCSDVANVGTVYAGQLNDNNYVTTAGDSGLYTQWSTQNDVTGANNDIYGGAETGGNLQILQDYYGADFATKAPAAYLCSSLGTGWYLPAIDELVLLRTNSVEIGGFLGWGYVRYLSSTENSASSVKALYGIGWVPSMPKDGSLADGYAPAVRCIKSTSP